MSTLTARVFGLRSPPPSSGPPTIDLQHGDLALLSTQAWDALSEANHPPQLFRYGGLLVRLERHDDGRLTTRPLTPDRVRHHLARVARWRAGKKNAFPSLTVAKDLLADPCPRMPVLGRIVPVPVFTSAGALLVTPGYDAASGLFFDEDVSVPTVSTRPPEEEIDSARRLITEDLLGDFPFTGDAERAHAVALLLLPFVRELIDGATPLHAIEKPSPGTGASLLVDALLWPALGRSASMMTEARDEDEWRKRITSTLLDNPVAIVIDNVRRRVDSAALSSAMTTGAWQDRYLGRSEMIRLLVRCAWVLTGNNIAVSHEIARRTVRIRLDAKTDRPWLREEFRHPNLLRWASTHRGDLIWAALTLGQAWLAAGRPGGIVALGMFEGWANVIGGILKIAGIPGCWLFTSLR